MLKVIDASSTVVESRTYNEEVKWFCKDSFKVTDIKYGQNREIIGLSISNEEKRCGISNASQTECKGLGKVRR